MAAPAPIGGDGRYYWYGTFGNVVGSQINFVGDPAFLTGVMSLTWSILQRSEDGSSPVITYSLDNGETLVSEKVGLEDTEQSAFLANGQIKVSLDGAQGISVNVTSAGGSFVANAKPWVIAIAINRNANETLPWSAPSPFNPLSYNCDRLDFSGYPSQTLAQLRVRMMRRLGFSNQATNPPPGMAALIDEFLTSAQTFLYRRYPALHTRRFFRWKLSPGLRFYSLKDNDDDVLSNFHLDPAKKVEWAGIQDTRNVWYPLVKGIPPQLYTMIDKPWRPARYDIRQGIEIYPAPDQTYWLWLRGHFGLLSFAADGDQTTIDSELVFLHALANAKAHYGQPDAESVATQADVYRKELIAGTHQTAHYVPGTTALPPAVRPTLVEFQDQSGG